MPMINKTSVQDAEEFTYTFQVSFRGLTKPAQTGYLVDFLPNGILYRLPKLGDGVTAITTDAAPDGTKVTFHFGPVDETTVLSFSLTCAFGPGHQSGDSFTNSASLYADGLLINHGSTSAVTLERAADFSHSSPAAEQPEQTISCTMPAGNDFGDAEAFVAQLLTGGDGVMAAIPFSDILETLAAAISLPCPPCPCPPCPCPPCPPPVIHARNCCLPLCANFQPLAGVSATDCQGHDLTQCIIVTANNVNTALSGCYHVTYSVTDCHCQTTLKTITVTVHTAEGCERVVNDILESVALEQAALAHILNAEGEKIQAALAIPCITVCQLLEINSSVNETIQSVISLEQALLQKLHVIKCLC